MRGTRSILSRQRQIDGERNETQITHDSDKKSRKVQDTITPQSHIFQDTVLHTNHTSDTYMCRKLILCGNKAIF